MISQIITSRLSAERSLSPRERYKRWSACQRCLFLNQKAADYWTLTPVISRVAVLFTKSGPHDHTHLKDIDQVNFTSRKAVATPHIKDFRIGLGCNESEAISERRAVWDPNRVGGGVLRKNSGVGACIFQTLNLMSCAEQLLKIKLWRRLSLFWTTSSISWNWTMHHRSWQRIQLEKLWMLDEAAKNAI